jgi:hypothetical protein
MRQVLRTVLILLAICHATAEAQSQHSVPRLVTVTGTFRPADGQPAGAVETVTVSIYADQEGGAPLWQ